jgi:hypothetical protein
MKGRLGEGRRVILPSLALHEAAPSPLTTRAHQGSSGISPYRVSDEYTMVTMSELPLVEYERDHVRIRR